MQVDRNTGRVTVVNIKTGKTHSLHAVDAREQLSVKDPVIRLPEVQTSEESALSGAAKASKYDFTQIPLETLREYAQDAKIIFMGKSRAQLEAELQQIGFIPEAKENE